MAAAWAGPAQAADQTVGIGANAYTPPSVGVDPGDKVTWRWNGPDTNHSVTAAPDQAERFDSDPGGGDDYYYGPSVPNLIVHFPGDTFSHTFTTPGSYTYFCRVHGFMRGTVVVSGATPPPASSPPAQGGAPSSGGGGPSSGGGSDPPAGGQPGGSGAPAAPSDQPAPAADADPPRIRGLRLKPSIFCMRRSRACRRAGSTLRFELSENADVTGRIAVARSGRLTGSLRARGVQGANVIEFRSPKLRPGSYRLTLTATDSAGNRSKPARASFRIRQS